MSADEAIVDGNLVTAQACLAHPRWERRIPKTTGNKCTASRGHESELRVLVYKFWDSE